MHKLDALNRAGAEDAAAMLSPAIERAPQIARRVILRRPFASTNALRAAIRAELGSLDEEQRVNLFREHPELGPENPLTMTAESQSEQGRLNLTASGNVYRVQLDQLNAQYRAKFGFPFITALVRHDGMDSVLAEFRDRLAADRATEIDTAIDQVAAVSSARIDAMFGNVVPEDASMPQPETRRGQDHGT